MSFQSQDLPIAFAELEKTEAAELVRHGKIKLMEGSGDQGYTAEAEFFRRKHRVYLGRDAKGRVEHDCTRPPPENQGTGCPHLNPLPPPTAGEGEEKAAEAKATAPWIPYLLVYPRENGPEARVALAEKGDDGALRPVAIDGDRLLRLQDADDRSLVKRIEAAAGGRRHLAQGGGFAQPEGPWSLPPDSRIGVLEAFSARGRLFGVGERQPLLIDPGSPAELWLSFPPMVDRAGRVRLAVGVLCGDQPVAIADRAVLAADRRALVRLGDRIVAVDTLGAHEWLAFHAKKKELVLETKVVPALLRELAAGSPLPRLSLPGQTEPVPTLAGSPIPRLRVKRERLDLIGEVSFVYAGTPVSPDSAARLMLAPDSSTQLRRDLDAESRQVADLAARTGVERDENTYGRFFLARSEFEPLCARLMEDQWVVEVDGSALRKPQAPTLGMKSGVDWFELQGSVEFDGGGEVSVAELLRAHREGQRFVSLGGGAQGMIPREWVSKLDRLLTLTGHSGPELKFRRAQAVLLEPLLGAELRGAADRELSVLRDAFRALSGSEALPPPAGFHGSLRPYQQAGLAWLRALASCRIGGCLADEMGLGKTIQALALLLELRERPPEGFSSLGPALVVAPKSLLWNWQEEAQKFAPGLRVKLHHGEDRADQAAAFAEADLWVTTYGTLQRDIEVLEAVEFGVVLLDEAQAIKNPRSKNFEAACRLRGHLRLSLTGTPVENSLRDLWAQMEFLNPGLLGGERRFLDLLSGKEGDPARVVLARALRPLLLRRTKAEVAQDLPPRIEQTLHAEMSREQLRMYHAIREEARRSLEVRIADGGLPSAKLHVLEALLRLRQAACHPGLVDPTRAAEGESGELELLLDEIESVLEGGGKALIYSQFVRFLEIVGAALRERGHVYAYLDGSTKDRGAVVKRFQEDPDCPLFLISLKAGGVGLNLTAAGYVFILDPWWNPAVESQAIDRAHRIGQTRQVVAYRLVARGTVEDRILDLQARKRELAEAIVAAEEGPLSALTEDDLRILLS